MFPSGYEVVRSPESWKWDVRGERKRDMRDYFFKNI